MATLAKDVLFWQIEPDYSLPESHWFCKNIEITLGDGTKWFYQYYKGKLVAIFKEKGIDLSRYMQQNI